MADLPAWAVALEFVVFGFTVGTYGTMVGAGGGFLIVPALMLLYGATPAQAAGTGLTCVFLNAASGTVSYAKQHRINYKAGIIFALATVPGAIIGAHLAAIISGRTFNVIFGIGLLAIAALLIWRPVVEEEYADSLIDEADASRWHFTAHTKGDEGETISYRYNWLIGVILSFFVGFASSILGIGGGIIHVPALIHILGFPPHLATATSHFILAITAAVGGATHLALGHVLFKPAIFMGIGIICGAQLGAMMARRLKGTLLVRLLSIALILVALRLLF